MSTSLSMLPSRNLVSTTSSRLWTLGRFALRVHGAGPEYDRPVEIRRPFALIGRAPGADVVLDDHAVNPRHVYLHLDRRGLFAVDLATRTGSRIGPFHEPFSWLRPGEMIEVAGYHIELAALHIDDLDPNGPGDADPLSDVADGPELSLYPDGGGMPLVLRSQLVFAGRDPACGVFIDDARLAPVQCVLARAEQGVYAADFLGGLTCLNERPLRGPALLCDGDVLAIGSARFECRLSVVRGGWSVAPESAATNRRDLALPPHSDREGMDHEEAPALGTRHLASNHPPRRAGLPQTTDNGPRSLSSAALDRLATEDQDAVLAWMMGALQATQGELLRRQDVFQRDVIRALRKMQKQQTLGHAMQLERLEHLNHEVAAMRDEVRRRYGASAPAHRAEPPRALPSVRPLPASGGLVDETDAWLARRIGQIQQENQAARKVALKK